MRRPTSRPFPIVLAAALVLAALPVAAQRAAAPAPVRLAARATGESVAVRTVAVYHFAAARRDGIPAVATVADSAGRLVARFRLPGERSERPMTVTIIGDDLVLQGETPSGVLTLQLRPEPGAAADAVTGEWRIDGRRGALRGVVRR